MAGPGGLVPDGGPAPGPTRRWRPAAADERSRPRPDPLLVPGRQPDPVYLEPQRQVRSLDDPARRQRPDPDHTHPGSAGVLPFLVAGRPADRLLLFLPRDGPPGPPPPPVPATRAPSG